MPRIEISKIQVPEGRQRQQFDQKALEDLADSIEEVGMIHPIVLETHADGREPKLVAGERRLRAIELLDQRGHEYYSACGLHLPITETFFVPTHAPDEIRRKEIELHENLKRENLTWQEETKAIAELHELRLSQNPDQTIVQTATELATTSRKSHGYAREQISKARVVEQHLNDPEVASAKSRNEAFKIITQKAQHELQKKLAEKVGEEGELKHSCTNAPMHSVIHKLIDGSVNLVIADPPYGMQVHKTFGTMQDARHEYDDEPDEALKLYHYIIVEAYRLLPKHAHLWLFLDISFFEELKNYANEAGFRVWRTPIIWDKTRQTMMPEGSYGLGRSYELIMLCIKGDKKLNFSCEDIFRVPPETEVQHAAQKPLALYLKLLQLSADPGDYVLDPCCGRGTIFLAAAKANMHAIGIEKNPEYFKIAQDNMEKARSASYDGAILGRSAARAAKQTQAKGGKALDLDEL